MPETPQIVLDFAVEQFIDTIQNLCDDPSWLEHNPDAEPGYGVHALDRLRQIAVALQLDFDTLVRQYGSEYEVERLLRIETKLRSAS